MNAKKIMGAVLVALLAAALFVGAGAAATAAADGTTVFVNQKLDKTIYGGNWIGSSGAVTPTPADEANKVYFPAGTEGVYTLKNGTAEYTLTVKSPEITISGVAGNGVSAYKFIGGVFYQGEANVDVKINQLTTLQAVDVYLTEPNGSEKLIGNNVSGAAYIENLLNKTTAANYPAVGEYSIRAVYKSADFVNGTLYTALVTKPVTFTVAEAGTVAITASVDKVLKSEPVKITITGQPGYVYNVSYDAYAFKGDGNQLGLPQVAAIGTTLATKYNFSFQMPNTGSVEFLVTGNVTDKTEKLSVKQLVPTPSSTTKTQSVVIEFTKGTISGKTDAASYFVGDEVTVTGTTSDGPIKNITLKGTNFEAVLVNTIGSAPATYPVNGFVGPLSYGNGAEQTFEFKINTGIITNQFSTFAGKKLDVGTYSLTLETANSKTSVAVVLKQPFISIVEAPEVIVQGDEAEFVVNAEASPAGIAYYIFGTNFFKAGKQPNADEGVTNQFTVTLEEDDTKANKMAAGQYFAVFQHPMYDKAFNIYATNAGDFYLNTSGDAAGSNIANETYLFSFDARQTANAAQALCDALDSQNIDDMYVKYSFFVVGEDESFSISEIPETVAQGSTFTVSGTSTAAAGEVVQVEMISTAFAAVPKENVGSAAFIVVTTTVADDGTWEVTLDTSDLNVDEYSLKVACGDDTWKNVKINVVEGADTPDTPDTPDVPDTPDTPDEPEAPATPGFGALAALAGLGAVAVLLLRRE